MKPTTVPSKKNKKKVYDGTSVRLSNDAYATIKDHCSEKGLIIGRFIEQTCLAKIKQSPKK